MGETDRIKWDERHSRQPRHPSSPAAVLLEWQALLPCEGRALDLAGGSGRNALWLARRGLQVTLADISTVALQTARRQAEAAGLRLDLLQVDLESQGVPAGPWDLVLVCCYLERSLFEQLATVLAAGGLLLYTQPTTINLERHAKPPERYLLKPGEFRALVEPHLEILRYEEGWWEEGRHEARVLARRAARTL